MHFRSLHLHRSLALLLLPTAWVLAGCTQAHPESADEAAVPEVQVAIAQAQALELTQELPGRVQALRTAEVRARVAGIVKKRHFQEGADVKAGQVLYQIDPVPFEIALERAAADALRADAALAEARATLDRSIPLAKVEAVSQQDLVAAQAAFQTARAQQAAARAEVKAAQLNLDYATVRAPIAGRIGRSLVTEGALVGQGEATVLGTIQQIDQVYVDLTQTVADAMRLKDALATGAVRANGTGAGARIVATVDGTGKTREGKLLFSDISVDPGTGQMLLRGQFSNADALLLPGMYVRVQVGRGLEPQALLLPQRAVAVGSDNRTTLRIVGPDDTVQVRPVQAGDMVGANWHIQSGLQAGERVVVGGPALTAGQKVRVAAPAQDK
ncbi:MAG TPA: efflux RND transporter periplasmic adaptor subunit [Pseudorhodoferax sp.]|jgi:multidrug efflux system membrane fusion protein|nr:efflux RND transporter periplasmic adaptor subunit [Pseudorhodoferax sp.]